MTGKFNQTEYWRARHRHMRGDPRSVGNKRHSLDQAIMAESQFVENVSAISRELRRDYSTVLDLGCGHGRASRPFTDAGYSYVGVDVSQDAIEQARILNGQAQFHVSDLNFWSTASTFDLVCFFYVLVHFVDDRDWESMVLRSLDWIGHRGGWLIADEFPEMRTSPAPHVVHRPLSAYESLLQSRGFMFKRSFGPHFRLARCI